MRIIILFFFLLNGMISFAQANAGVTDTPGSGGNYFTSRVEKNKKIVYIGYSNSEIIDLSDKRKELYSIAEYNLEEKNV